MYEIKKVVSFICDLFQVQPTKCFLTEISDYEKIV